MNDWEDVLKFVLELKKERDGMKSELDVLYNRRKVLEQELRKAVRETEGKP